jgi:hypothetical protein
MSEDCEVCQEHAKAYEDAPTDTERRMVVFVWRHHDAMEGHHVFRYHDEDEGLTIVHVG